MKHVRWKRYWWVKKRNLFLFSGKIKKGTITALNITQCLFSPSCELDEIKGESKTANSMSVKIWALHSQQFPICQLLQFNSCCH
jgi:hypothetical protein